MVTECLYPEAQHNMLKSIHGKFHSSRTREYFWSYVQHKSKTAFSINNGQKLCWYKMNASLT